MNEIFFSLGKEYRKETETGLGKAEKEKRSKCDGLLAKNNICRSHVHSIIRIAGLFHSMEMGGITICKEIYSLFNLV